MIRRLVFASVALACCSTLLADNWQIPLTCPAPEGPSGWRPITIGVPLLPGQAKTTRELHVLGKSADGKMTELSAQFRVLARWWYKDQMAGNPDSGDNSIRWVLIDTAVNVQPGKPVELVLTNAGQRSSTLEMESVTDDAITVDTGVAKFVISRKKFNLLDQATVNGVKLLDSSAQTGGVIEDTYGNRYYGSAGTTSVTVVESGPVRVQVRAKGKFIDPSGRGYSKGMYRYDVLMNFYAGRPEVYVDYVIVNNAGQSIGSPTFEDASVLLKLAQKPAGGRLYGEKPTNFSFGPAGSFCLYQDSLGCAAWAGCPGVGHMHSNGYTYPKGTLTSFRGFRIYQRATAAQQATTQPEDCGDVVAGGDRALGLLQVSAPAGDLVVYVPKFWQLFPKALEAGADGAVRIGLFPHEFKGVHYFEDASGSGTEFVLSFAAPPSADPASKERIAPLMVDPAAVAATWERRLMPRPTLEHSAACGALADLGPYSVPTTSLDKKPDSRIALYSDRSFTTDELYGNAYGWQIFGERWRSNGGHGRRGARQPIDEDNYLFRWLVGGRGDWFDAGDARNRQFRDVRVYQIDIGEQDPFGFKDWNAFRAANRNEDWTNRPQPKDAEYLKYTQGRYSRSDWPFPNPEHTTIDLLYDRYLLFGDVRCYENMRIGAAHGGYFSGRGGSWADGWPWRANGWGMRALFRYWDLTGDKEAEACLRDVIATHAKHIGTKDFICHNDVRKAEINWWFTNIYCRGVSMMALHTGDPKMLELLKTLAAGKEAHARNVPALFAVLYHLTGDEKYKKLVLGDDDGAKLLTVGGYYPACDHWLLHQPPAKR
ncbi:MAG: hypothetical protein BIFFINMI_04402 [Phycisphaerae bacterium]|nr:hypothetical protein [Phycisphaerae bacterium]